MMISTSQRSTSSNNNNNNTNNEEMNYGTTPTPTTNTSNSFSLSHRSSHSSSLSRIRESASTMFESIMGRRRMDDYPVDYMNDPQQNVRNQRIVSPNRFRTTKLSQSIREEDDTTGINHNNQYPSEYNQGNTTPSHNHHHRRSWFCPLLLSSSHHQDQHPQQQQNYYHILYRNILKSHTWQFFMILFAFILLFGDPIRVLFLPPILDNIVNTIFIITILFFLFDIIMRCYIEDSYFTIPNTCCCWYNKTNRSNSNNNNNNNNSDNNNNNHNNNNPRNIYIQWITCGSFLFWCDFLSTISLIYDISWIWTREEYIHISLDSYNVPISGLQRINQARPIELDPSLLISILQSARVARFIRSSTAVKISSKVNWFYLLNIFNPIWWIRQCTSCCWSRGRFGNTKSNSNSHNMTSNSNTRMSMESHMSGVGTATPSTTSLPGSPTNLVTSSQQPLSSINNRVSIASSGTTSMNGMPSNDNMQKPSSWGVVGTRALITVRVNKHTGRPEAKGISGLYNNIIKRLGFIDSSEMDEMKYQCAAMKIQRAWRTVLYQRQRMDEITSGEFTDIGWKGRASISHTSTSIRIPTSNNNTRTRENNNLSGHDTVPPPSTSVVPTAMVGSTTMNNDINNKRRNESQVGSAMRELTGQRVAIGIIVALLLTVTFTYTEEDATRPTTMIVLHAQTGFDQFANKSLTAARMTSVPDLYSYQLANGEIREYDVVEKGRSPSDLRINERVRISIASIASDTNKTRTTIGLFSYRSERCEEAVVSILSTLFILLLWFFGVTAFAGPVMVLVVIPIERMVRLLGMLMVDPLGYQSTSRYKRFVDEENEITKNTRWTREILKGMETSFLMSTILRIGSLMKVGFGSAGVEIIRNNLEKGQSKNMLILNSQGSTVSCIFLFCDIRNFTDATECLQEEVFVFTNRIAAVVHSNVHSYGGSANKNVGDAFLLSWLLDEDPNTGGNTHDKFSSGNKRHDSNFTAKSNQADKCLLSVVRICMALYHDDYYIGAMTEAAREALILKLKYRKGPIVQMGFGMHAGRAVQGAIGSQRKIDATYVSEAVERAEFLESSTKKYGVRMLMSDSFHRLLHPSNRRRCRKVDQILIQEEYDDDNEEDDKDIAGEIMELFTFDLDIDSLWAKKNTKVEATIRENESSTVSEKDVSRRGNLSKQPRENRRSSNNGSTFLNNDSDELNSSSFLGTTSNNNNNQPPSPSIDANKNDDDPTSSSSRNNNNNNVNSNNNTPTLVLPTGPALYNSNVWTSDDMRTMRQLYSDGLFFQNFMSGLQSYYAKDWDHATQCFTTILQRFEDGPSRYFLSRIEEHNGKPPKDFCGYGIP